MNNIKCNKKLRATGLRKICTPPTNLCRFRAPSTTLVRKPTNRPYHVVLFAEFTICAGRTPRKRTHFMGQDIPFNDIYCQWSDTTNEGGEAWEPSMGGQKGKRPERDIPQDAVGQKDGEGRPGHGGAIQLRPEKGGQRQNRQGQNEERVQGKGSAGMAVQQLVQRAE